MNVGNRASASARRRDGSRPEAVSVGIDLLVRHALSRLEARALAANK